MSRKPILRSPESTKSLPTLLRSPRDKPYDVNRCWEIVAASSVRLGCLSVEREARASVDEGICAGHQRGECI